MVSKGILERYTWLASMSIWRLLGECPQAVTREELNSLSLEGWNPWRENWTRLDVSDIVLADVKDPTRRRHLRIYEVKNGGAGMMFAADCVAGTWRFYVPAEEGTAGAIEAIEPRYEGHWRASYNEASELPWPQVEYNWHGREPFLQALSAVEAKAERISYRGYSLCRFCGCTNEHEGLRVAEWEWPAGYRHYIVAHDVIPSAEFAEFILARAT
jgi:hypothetical protein